MHLEAVIARVLGGRDGAGLAMHLEAVIVRDCRCT